MNLSFNRSVAPTLFYRGRHRFVVSMDTGNEALQFGDTRRYASCQPCVEGIRISIVEDLAELLREALGGGDVRMAGSDRVHPALFV